MKTGQGVVQEIFFERIAVARLTCPNGLIPAAGQYLLADATFEQSSIIPVPIFPAGSADGGFLAAFPFPTNWHPGTSLSLRGPLGNGFNLPAASRSVALVSFSDTVQRLAALIVPAIAQGAAVTMISAQPPTGLPNAVEIMPIESLPEALHWADYIALDMPREMVPSLPNLLPNNGIVCTAQVLLTSPMPCGGRGDCGVCAVSVKRGYKLICKDGPVFDLKNFLQN
jgi:NAD(P)H-flavin reductase